MHGIQCPFCGGYASRRKIYTRIALAMALFTFGGLIAQLIWH